MTTTYTVTKHFTSGLLSGLTLTEQTTVQFKAGTTYKGVLKSSSYVVISCQENS